MGHRNGLQELQYVENHDGIVSATASLSTVAKNFTGLIVEDVEETPVVPTGSIRVGAQASSSSSTAAAMAEAPPEKPDLGYRPTNTERRSHLFPVPPRCRYRRSTAMWTRSIRGQIVLVCGDCVTTHPKQLPKLHPRVLFDSHESMKRNRERDPPLEGSGGTLTMIEGR
eukprot:2257831-Amphidinium_carterae.1